MKTALFALSLAVSTFAQQPKPSPAPPPAKAEAELPAMTELQKTKLELYDTQINDTVREANSIIAPLQQKRTAVINEVQAANPGWMFKESQNGQPSQWVKIPPAPKKDDTPAAPAVEAPKK